MFEAQASNDWASFSSNLSLYISQMLCKKLGGDLTIESLQAGKPTFIFYMNCIMAKQVNLASSLPNLSNESNESVGKRILLLTHNVIDRLAI